ncbi:uncharacterized protein EI90DRAFT_3042945 [Cantharellus anzutake]|uniref:uncharacterized protein n=1 Tax=Cantharellus anzutake TaxID=1750568 RepID=UPI001902C7AF|nr:uncharacterized protein EI90DRAFT_3042945 [Cantharellus anzutake]KAF8337428.1 hypothetical protein EI90DRAFT_3042945 [Cantharellus anzutake]
MYNEIKYSTRGEGDAMYMQVMVQDAIVLGMPNCPQTHAEEPPWCEAVLVTACHAVRTQWNELALRLHCRRTGTVLYRFRAEDTTRELRLSERWAIAHHVFKEGHTGRLRGFPSVVELAIRGKVIITTNLDTDIDVVNGIQGQKVGIWADPSCALVKLE